MKSRAKKSIIWVVSLFLLASIWIIIVQYNPKTPYRNISGLIFGTVYNITYQSNDSLKSDIDAALNQVDGSLSMFNDTSIIARINRNQPVVIDSLFEHCFKRSMEVSKLTDGDFDITVCPLVNAWGFGFKGRQFPTAGQIDSLRQFVGYQKIKLIGKRVEKADSRVMLDLSAVAKGYAVDVVSYLLNKKGVKNYMIDIGGEVVIKGKNPQGNLWKIGINRPIDDSLAVNQELEGVLNITDRAIATSGNYRNYYYKEGKKYSHEINPHTGYPALNEVLSSTVISKDCMTSDALATAIMVMGLKKAEILVSKLPDVETYIIYRGKGGTNKIYYSQGMDKYLKKK